MPMKLRNKKKAFTAMALVALATPQATAIADSDSVNPGSNPGPSATNPSDIASYFLFWQQAEAADALLRIDLDATQRPVSLVRQVLDRLPEGASVTVICTG